MRTPEAKVKEDIKKELKARGFVPAGGVMPAGRFVPGWYYMPVSNGMGTHGIPDIVGCWYGRFFSIEAKAPGKEPTEMQVRRHEEIRRAGGVVLVVDDVNILRDWLAANEAEYERRSTG